jgi:hypothetical protein
MSLINERSAAIGSMFDRIKKSYPVDAKGMRPELVDLVKHWWFREGDKVFTTRGASIGASWKPLTASSFKEKTAKGFDGTFPMYRTGYTRDAMRGKAGEVTRINAKGATVGFHVAGGQVKRLSRSLTKKERRYVKESGDKFNWRQREARMLKKSTDAYWYVNDKVRKLAGTTAGQMAMLDGVIASDIAERAAKAASKPITVPVEVKVPS